MKKVSKLVALGLAGCLAASVCAGCGSNNASSGESKKEEAAKGKVYYLNFKPEQDEQWQSLAKAYTE